MVLAHSKIQLACQGICRWSRERELECAGGSLLLVYYSEWNPSNKDTIWTEERVLVREVSSFLGFNYARTAFWERALMSGVSLERGSTVLNSGEGSGVGCVIREWEKHS